MLLVSRGPQNRPPPVLSTLRRQVGRCPLLRTQGISAAATSNICEVIQSRSLNELYYRMLFKIGIF